MEIRAFAADEIFAENGIERNRLLLVKDGRFAGFISSEQAAIENIPVERFPGCLLLPGLFDSHIHGAMGRDTMDGNRESLDIIGKYLLSEGTTSWMPTTVTADLQSIRRALQNLADYEPAAVDTAKIYGCFVEGPYLTAAHRGAHPAEYLREVSLDEFEQLYAAGPVTALAVAPEKQGADAFIQQVTSRGVHVSLAHTSASYEESIQAIDHGADAVVHTFCGMSPLHHRNPCLLGAALTRDDVYTELIADGIHVQKPAMEILLRCKPKDRMLLVSDAISATGLPDGEYVLGVEKVQVKDGISRTSSGSLAGSTTVLLSEVRRLILELGTEPLSAVHMASLNPSRRFGLEHEIGSIRAGKQADFLIVDKRYELREVWKNGKKAVARR